MWLKYVIQKTFLRCKKDCKESISLKWTKISNSFHRQLFFFVIESRSALGQHMGICKKIWSVQSVIFKIFNSCWLSNKSLEKKPAMIHNISMFFSFSFSCFMSLLLNTMKAAAEAGWRLSLCSLWCWMWHSCWNNGARIKISSFSLTHCSRQLRSFAELSSEPLLWLQIFFSCSDCFDMEKTPEWSLSPLQASFPAVWQFPA